MDLVSPTSEGLYCQAGDFHIDPSEPVTRAAVTHAHGDHARPGSRQYFCAAPSLPFLARRLGEDALIVSVPYGERIRIGEADVSFHPAGHVLGSAQVRIAHEGRVWVITGDYKRQADPTCAPFEPLEADGLVVRQADARDRRTRLAALTPAGREAVEAGSRVLEEAEREAFRGLTSEEAQQLEGLLKKLGPR